MKKAIIGYILSFLTSVTFVAGLNYISMWFLPLGAICFVVSTFFAWVIGDMSWNYGEDDEK